MSTAGLSRQHATLRSVVYRLQSTNVESLPPIIPHLCRSLVDCKDIICSEKQAAKDGPEAATLTKLKTLVSGFLIHETPEKRWTAVVLIKTLVGLGGFPILHTCAPWIQGLFGVLKRPLSDSGKKAAVIAITTILNLTHSHPTLLREITTPALPQYITHTLKLVFPKTDDRNLILSTELTIAILESYSNLLPRHPSIFRSFVPQIKEGLLPFLAPTPSSTDKPSPAIPTRVAISAQGLYSLLPATVPKNGSSGEWTREVALIMDAAHLVADQIFRSTIEEWTSLTRTAIPGLTPDSFRDQPKQADPDLMHLPPWSSVNAGCERIIGLIGLLEAFVTSKTASPVFVPLGRIFDLITRLLTTTVPAAANKRTNQRIRAEASREEQDSLWSSLPLIHVAVLELLEALCERLSKGLLPFAATVLDQIDWIFQHESFNVELRTQTYILVARLLDDFGPGFSKLDTKQLNRIIKACSEDLVPTTAVSVPASINAAPAGSILGSGTKPDESNIDTTTPQSVREAADRLLASYLFNVPSRTIPLYMRTLLDRTVILNQNPKSMLASVLNPAVNGPGDAKPRPSILPFLARAHPHHMEVEAVLRPRMPVVAVGSEAPSGPQESDEESNEDEDQDEESGQVAQRGFSSIRVDDEQDDKDALSKVFAAAEPDTFKRKRETDQEPPSRSSSPLKRAKNDAASSLPAVKATDKNGRDVITAGQTLVAAEPDLSEANDKQQNDANVEGDATHGQPPQSYSAAVPVGDSDSDSEGEFVVPQLTFDESGDESDRNE